MKKKSLKEYSVLVPALVGLLGVLVGCILMYASSRILWHQQKFFYINEALMQKRFELIDRLAVLNGQRPGINELWVNHLKDIPNNTVLSEKLGNYGGEYSSVVFQSSFYFGDDTNEAARKLNESKKPWWEKPQEDYDALLSAMRDEMIDGIKGIVEDF